MSDREVVLSTPDSTLRTYSRAFDCLTLEFEMWDESTKQVNAFGVTRLEDDGTWEADALVRVPELDAGTKTGYGVINVEGALTLRFVADRIEV
jgi:hypothetical protein